MLNFANMSIGHKFNGKIVGLNFFEHSSTIEPCNSNKYKEINIKLFGASECRVFYPEGEFRNREACGIPIHRDHKIFPVNNFNISCSYKLRKINTLQTV